MSTGHREGGFPMLGGHARLIRIAGWVSLLAATGLLVNAEALRPDLPEGIEAYRDLVYRTAGARRVRLDVYVPRAQAPPGGWPAIVAIHGGGWRGGSRKDYGAMIAGLAAPRAPGDGTNDRYVVISVDYQLSRPGVPSWPANLDDVREAIRWVRRHSADYHVDPGRIVAMGASAGGHLAALLGTDPDGSPDDTARPTEAARVAGRESAQVQAVVDFYGPTDLRVLAESRDQARWPIALFLGGTPAECPERYRDASPVCHVSAQAPPMLLIHGDDDPLIPLDQPERLLEALRRAGVEARLIVVPGAKHGFGLKVANRDLTPEVLAFLDGVWKGREDGRRP